MIAKIGDLVIANHVKVASTTIDRMIGLMFKEKMMGFDALLIEPCNSIHTFFMCYPIDVIFLNKNYEVVKIIRNMKPWRLSAIYFRATKVLELQAGTLPENVSKGDKLVMHV